MHQHRLVLVSSAFQDVKGTLLGVRKFVRLQRDHSGVERSTEFWNARRGALVVGVGIIVYAVRVAVGVAVAVRIGPRQSFRRLLPLTLKQIAEEGRGKPQDVSMAVEVDVLSRRRRCPRSGTPGTMVLMGRRSRPQEHVSCTLDMWAEGRVYVVNAECGVIAERECSSVARRPQSNPIGGGSVGGVGTGGSCGSGDSGGADEGRGSLGRQTSCASADVVRRQTGRKWQRRLCEVSAQKV